MCSAGSGNLVSVWQQIAAGQVDRARPCEDVFASGERLVIFHLNAYKCFCPALAAPSALSHFKMHVLLSQFSHKLTSFNPSLISHLVPAITFNVFIPPVKALHILLFPYLHCSSSFSLLDLCGPARCFTTRARGGLPLPAVAQMRAWR